MDKTIEQGAEPVEIAIDSTDFSLLAESQLALVGGGIGETVL